MNERDLFLSALEIDDPAARRAHLQAACADNGELLSRVESLLASHEGESRFLQTPVVEQLGDDPTGQAAATLVMGTGSTHDESPSDEAASMLEFSQGQERNKMAEETPLGYLEPSTKPGSIGRLAHYEILEVVGQGAFGTVLRAFDEKLQRVVAIKVMAPELAATSPARKRFIREAQASAQIRHENVVNVYSVEEKPIPYLVMEYIPGETLQHRLDERGPLDVPTVLRLGTQIAEGLAAAHAKDLIHRDIKPGNILLETGLRDRVKITDFGLARAADDASMSQSGVIAGTPMYMAPEQALGHKLDQRADLFSLGSVLYQMASGRPPFRASSTLAVLKRLTEEMPRPIQEIIPETPRWLCDIISKLHAKNPDDRFQTAKEVAELLEQHSAHLQNPSQVLRPASVSLAPAKPHTGPELRPLMVPQGIRRPLLIATAIMFLLAALLLAVTESTGLTHLFSGSGVAQGPSPPDAPKPDRNVVRNPFAVAPFTDADVKRIAALPAAEQVEEVRKELMRRNPGFDGRLGISPDIDPATKIEDGVVTELRLVTDNVSDISPVRALAGLKILWCQGSSRDAGQLADLSPLKGMSLESFSSMWNRKVADLSPLKGMPTMLLNVWGTNLANIDVVRRMPITVLFVADTPVTDLSPLAGKSLALLACEQSKVKTLQGLPIAEVKNLHCDLAQLPDKADLVRLGVTEINGKPVAEFFKENENAAKTPSTDPDRLAAEYVLAIGGAVQVKGQAEYIDAVANLPPDAFRLITVHLMWNAQLTDADLGRFKDCKELGGVVLTGAPHVSDAGLAHFKDYKNLLAVGLSYTQVSDAGLAHFKDRTNLLAVGLEGTNVSDAGLAHFKDCKNLRDVRLTGTKVSDVGLAHFKDCKDLTYLGLGDTQVSDAGLAHFKDCKNLVDLKLDHTQVSDAVLAHFKDCKDLEDVKLGYTQVSDAVLAHFKDHKNLVAVGLEGTNVSDAGLANFKDCKNLVDVRLGHTQMSDAGLAHFKGMPLRVLFIDNTGITDLTPLQGMPLEEIHLTPKNITRGLDILRAMKSLKSIGIESDHAWPAAEFWEHYDKGEFAVAAFTDDDVKRIAALPAAEQVEEVRKELVRRNPGFDGTLEHKIEDGVVTELHIVTDKVTDIAPIRVWSSLRVLDCSGTHTPDWTRGYGQLADLAPLKGMNLAGLTRLNLNWTMVGDEGLAHFRDCKELTRLHIGFTKVTDLSLIKEMPLKELDCNFRPERDAEILRSIKTLEKINGKPAAEFWKEFDEQAASARHETWLKATALLPLDQHAAALPAKLKAKLPGFDNAFLRAIPDMSADRQVIMAQAWLTERKPAFAGFDDAWLKAIPSMAADTQVILVTAWLKERNLAFDGELTHKTEGGVLTSLDVPSPLVYDLTPLRVLTGLRSLTCLNPVGYDNRAESDAAVLRSLKKLESINGKSLAQFWKEIEARPAEFKEWLELVSTLNANQKVAAVAAKFKERNPGFGGVVRQKVENGVVTELTFENVRDLSPLRALEGLTVLNCTVGPLSDLSPLKGLPLTTLSLRGTQVRDLSPLTGTQLTSLDLYSTQVRDLEPLKGLPLTSLNLQFTKVQNLEPLKDMPLTRLHLNGCDQIRDLAPLKGMPLTKLELYRCRQVRDLEPLKDMPLTYLHLGSCPEVRDLEVLKGMPLTKLLINNTGVTDLKPLQALPLEYIRLTPKNITQGLDVLRDMKSLKTIGVTENQDLPAAEFWERLGKGEFKE